jgi:O-antigen/teichoic acid export membrane protein
MVEKVSKQPSLISEIDLKEEIVQEEVNKRVAIVIQQIQSGTIKQGNSEFKMLFIDKNFMQFLARHKKSIIIAGIAFTLGWICAFVWSYILILIIGFVAGYCFRYYYLFKNMKKE